MPEQGFETGPRTLVLEMPEKTEAKVFDPSASVRMIRHDLKAHGRVLPETQDQVYDEELSFVAEGVDRHCYTQFDLSPQDDMGLTVFQEGEWRPYKGMVITGQKTATAEAAIDHRKQFLKEWADRDVEIVYQMEGLEEGESINWTSPFPYKEQKLYGDAFLLEDCGLQPKRRMGFIYRAERNADGTVSLESHSVDNSDPDAFVAVEAALEENPDLDIHSQVMIYDEALSLKYGQEFKAGRTEAEDEANAFEFIENQKEYVEVYFEQIEKLAWDFSLNGEALERRKKKITYGLWARIKELLNENDAVYSSIKTNESVSQKPRNKAEAAADMERAYYSASSRGEVMPGCGGSIKIDDLLNLSPAEALARIFGLDLREELSWHGGKKKMGACVNCKKTKIVGVESWCQSCIKC